MRKLRPQILNSSFIQKDLQGSLRAKSKSFLVVCLLNFCIAAVLPAQNAIDVRIFRAINNHRAFSDNFLQFQSNTVKPIYIGTPIGLLAYGLIAKDKRSEDAGALMMTSAILNLGLTVGMKYTFDRTRPYKALNNVHTVGTVDRDPSFPSGHTSSAFATATMVSLEYKKWYVIVPAYTWAGLIGYSRIAMGVHYPSDVLMGALVGAGSSYLIYKLREPIIRFKDRILH